MSTAILTSFDFGNAGQLLNVLMQSLASDPGLVESKFYYNSTAKEIRYCNGTTWVALGPAGAGGPPTGAAGGDLTGSYPNPQIAAGTIVDADVATANKDGLVAVPSMRTLGTGAQQALAGNTRLNQLGLPLGSVSMNSQNITSLADPANPQEAATKSYVDNVAAGLAWKSAVRVATTVNGTLSSAFTNGQVVDGVTLVTGNRILVKNQTTTTENGIYTVTAAVPSRANDANTGAELEQACVFVEEGTLFADTSWVCTTNAPITIGSTGLTFAQFGGGSSLVAGAGITQTGNLWDIVSTTGDITVQADTITAVSAPKWTTGRTITLTGDVTGVSGAFDGSGNLSFATVNATAPKFFAGDVGAGTAPVITHNLNTRDCKVEVYRTTTPWDTVICDVERTTVNTVTLRFATSVSAAAFRCVVTGR